MRQRFFFRDVCRHPGDRADAVAAVSAGADTIDLTGTGVGTVLPAGLDTGPGTDDFIV